MQVSTQIGRKEHNHEKDIDCDSCGHDHEHTNFRLTTMIAGVARVKEEVIDRNVAESLWPYMDQIEFEKGTKIVAQGDRVNDSSQAFIIVSGEVVIMKDGLPLLINDAPMTRGAGVVIGEAAFLENKPRAADCVSSSTVLRSQETPLLTRVPQMRIAG